MNIFVKPIITEKTMSLASQGKFSFVVENNATKPKIRAAAKLVFGVDAIDIKTVIVKGSSVRVGKTRAFKKSSDWKKAVLTLKSGQKIDLFDIQGGQNA